MAIIGFHVSEMTSYDEVHLDYVIVAFYEMGTEKVEHPITKEMVDVETWDTLVDCERANIATLTTWERKTDLVGNYRVKFTAKDFGRIAWDDKAAVAAFCVNELDKLKATHTIRESQRKVG